MGLVMRTGVTAGWGAPLDRHVLLLSTGYVPGTKPLIVWCGPYKTGAVNVNPGVLGSVWARWGYPVVCCDLGQARLGGDPEAESEWNGNDSPDLFTSDVPLDGIDTCYDTIAPAIGALSGPGVGPIGIAGASGGGVKVLKWAHDNPTKCFGVLTIIGAVNLLEMQQRATETIPGIRAAITAILGDPVPAARNPATLGATWDATRPPLRAYYSGQDATCPPAETIGLVDAINAAGGTAEAIQQNNNNHDYYTGLALQEAAAWLVAQV